MSEFLPSTDTPDKSQDGEHRTHRSMEVVHGLLERVRQGDESSFNRLVDLYESIVDRMMPEFKNKAQFPEDLRQEGMAALIKELRRTVEYRGETPEEVIEYDKLLTVRINGRVRRALEAYTEKDPKVNTRRHKDTEALMQGVDQAQEGSHVSEMNEELMSEQPLSIDDIDDIPGGIDTVEEVLRRVLKSDINTVLSQLGERERNVLELRFGLNGKAVHTVESICNTLGLSVGRVYQIEKKAFRHIRRDDRAQGLRHYLRS